MVHFSVIRVKGSPSYDFDACGDILAMAKAVGVMTENMRTDRCDNTQCDGSRCKGARKSLHGKPPSSISIWTSQR